MADTVVFGDGIQGPEGEGSTVDNAVPRWDGTDGNKVQNSGITVDDSDNIIIPGNLSVQGTITSEGDFSLEDSLITLNDGGTTGGDTLISSTRAAGIEFEEDAAITGYIRTGLGTDPIVSDETEIKLKATGGSILTIDMDADGEIEFPSSEKLTILETCIIDQDLQESSTVNFSTINDFELDKAIISDDDRFNLLRKDGVWVQSVPQIQAVNKSTSWTIQTSAADNDWINLVWSPELGIFCAISTSGTGNRVMTSPNGSVWTIQASAADNNWVGLAWSPELGIFCAVSTSGTGNRVMTSPNGSVWTIQASAADNNWRDLAWSPELGVFCAVSNSGVGNRVMTSPNGSVWTIQASAADNDWVGLAWSPELGIFCAVSNTGTGNRVMTSPNGSVWTIQASAADNNWRDLAWSPELGIFCAVSTSGTGNRVMTSVDSVTWISQISATDNNWFSLTWSPELGIFCAVSTSGTGNRVMTSVDSTTWISQTSAADNGFTSIAWSPELGIFCTVSNSGVGNRVMVSANGFFNTGVVTGPIELLISKDQLKPLIDMTQIYSKDSSDGASNATLAIRTEQPVEVIGTFTPSHKLKIWINGIEYWLQLDAV